MAISEDVDTSEEVSVRVSGPDKHSSDCGLLSDLLHGLLYPRVLLQSR